MELETMTATNVKQAVPFFGVSNIEESVRWVTSLADPDGYRIEFENRTDVPEDTEYSEQESD